jgi:putative copper export protein
MGEIARRFTPLADVCIILLIVTGALMLLPGKSPTIEWTDSRWILTLIAKHIMVLGMVCIHYYRRLILTSKIGRTAEGPGKASLQKLSINLVWVNLWLGLAVLMFSSALAV